MENINKPKTKIGSEYFGDKPYKWEEMHGSNIRGADNEIRYTLKLKSALDEYIA